MSDPLGLLQNDDPLGLMTTSRPVPVLRSAPPEESSLLGDMWDNAAEFLGLKNTPIQERAKAANIMAISGQTGVAPSIVNDHYEEMTKELEMRDQPTFKDMIERPMMGAVVYGLMAHPMATVVGVTAFGVLSEAENYIASKALGKPYQFGAGRGLADILPEDMAQGFKDLVWTADMAVKAVASGAAIKGSKAATEQFINKFMRDTIETYNLPRSVFISPEKLREFHGLGRENVISPEETAILKDLGLTRQQYIDGLRDGIDIEIPAEKLVRVVDKPWWGKLKELFRVSPYEETVFSRGASTAKKPVAGLIEEPAPGAVSPEASPGPVIPLETGKVSKPAEIVQPAAEMKAVGGDIIEPKGEMVVNPLDDPNTLLEMAARTDEMTSPPITNEYDKIRIEAARIAYENVTKKIDIKKRKEDALLKRQGLEDARENPTFIAMNEIIAMGGLDSAQLGKVVHKDVVAELARKRIGLVSKAGKFGVDVIAERLGYESQDAMIDALLNWEGLPAAAKKAAADFEASYYDLLSSSEKEDFHLMLLEEEAKVYRKMLKETGKPSTPGIKKVIREQTGQIRVEELMVSEYEALNASMKKAEQASRVAFREGKIEGALAEKERQIGMALARREKLKAKEEAKGIHKGIIDITKDKSLPEDYRDRISALLEDYDILPRSAATAARVESAREFIERQKQAGEDVTIPESMLNRIERYGKIHWRELTLDQLREIYDQAKMYQHLGKLKNKLIASKKRHDFEKTIDTMISNIEKNWGAKKATQEDFERMFLETSKMEGAAEFKENYIASLTKVETYLRRLDGFKDLAPVWETVYLPIKEASDVEFRKLTDITTELQKLFDPIKKTLTKEKFKIPGVKQFMTREKVLMVALNSGNEGNLAALRDNKVYKWTDAEISAILANVTPEEWALVRGVWSLFDRQFPELAKVYKNLSGTELKKVEGDYFPLVFDRKLSWIADRNATEAEMRDFFQSIYTRPAVKTGSTIERVGGKLPPKLELSVIFEKLAEINHYITHAEAVRDVQKILGDPRVRYAIESAPAGIGGPEAYREMLSWLQDVARQKTDPLSAVEQAIKTARINTTTVSMAWKFSTAVVQFLGLSNTIYKIGGDYTARGLAEFYTHRGAMVEKINGLSAEMAGRSKSFDRELRDAYNRLGLEHFRKSAAIKDTFFSLISLMDMAVAYPTWLGAYDKGMSEFKDESKAIEYADMIVRTTQGAALTKDLAGIQRGSEMKKILSMFYTFFSSYQQMMADSWIRLKTDPKKSNFADFAKAWWWLTIVPALLDYVIKERDVPGPGKLVGNVINQRLTAYPVVRDIMGMALTDYDYQFSPVARAGEVMARGVNEAGKALNPDEEVDFDKLIRYSLESAGYVVGIPTGQAVVTMQGLIDLKNGETSDLSRLLFRAPRESED